jgi:hypothetical protein
VSAVPPTRSKAARLLPTGELGCGFRSLTPRAFELSIHSQLVVMLEDMTVLVAFFSGELGCGFCPLCSPHSVP